jgi:hypothetical protein
MILGVKGNIPVDLGGKVAQSPVSRTLVAMSA